MTDTQLFHKQFKRFNKVVIWGLRSVNNTYRYIQGHFFETLRKLEYPVVWVDDEIKNGVVISNGDLVISANVGGNNLPIKKEIFYCLHNFDSGFYKNISDKRRIVIQVYTNDAEKGCEKWDKVTFFDREKQILYQPWGTNLLPGEFYEPVYRKRSPLAFFIGSIWDNLRHQGNIRKINELKKVLKNNNLTFIHLQGVPDWWNAFLVRASRIAPAIAGEWQERANYLPCRVFKNVSYGQIAVTNVGKFHDLFKGFTIDGKDIEELIGNALLLKAKDYIELVYEQQKEVKKHTYFQSLLNISKAFAVIN
ncbi:MAG: hypothetical protein M1366_04610 [Patescibacteria group bacterium]|nr:hypothetical protein [Patescibacteria group bacterium]